MKPEQGVPDLRPRTAIPPPYAGASLKHLLDFAGDVHAGQFPRPTRGPH